MSRAQKAATRMASQANKSFGIYEKCQELQRAGADIIHLEIGRPFHDTPAHIKEAAKSALDAGLVHYGDLQGSEPLREALAARYRVDRGMTVGADEVLITCGATQASFAAFMAFLDEGDEVIVMSPFYPQHNSKIQLAGARVVSVPMVLKDGLFRVDPDAIATAIKPATRMIVLINPANPCGSVCTLEELRAIAALAEKHDLLVLADEVYDLQTFDGHRHISIASLPGMFERTITISACTKSYAMDGWRIGYAVAPASMIAQMRRITMNATTHPCVFAQAGAVAAISGSQECVQEMLLADRVSRDLLVERLNAIAGVRCHKPQGGSYVFADFRAIDPDDNALVLRLLYSAHVAVEAGSFYGPAGAGHVRICFSAEPQHRVAEAVDRIERCLSERPRGERSAAL